MIAPTGRNRVPRVPEEAPNNVDIQNDENYFPHPAPPTIAAVVNEVGLEGMSLKDELGEVEKKIKEALASEEKNPELLRKLARERSFLMDAVLAEQPEQNLE